MNTLDVKILARALKDKIANWKIHNTFGNTDEFVIHIGNDSASGTNSDIRPDAGSLIFKKQGDFSCLYFSNSFPKPAKNSWKPGIPDYFIDDVEAIDSDRIILLHLSKGNDQDKKLYIEITGRRANLILTDENDIIITCLIRITGPKNSYRKLIAGSRYKLPPPMERLCPSVVQSHEIWERWISKIELAIKESTIRSRFFWEKYYEKAIDSKSALELMESIKQLDQPMTLFREDLELLPFYIDSLNAEIFNSHLDAFSEYFSLLTDDIKGEEYKIVQKEIEVLQKKKQALQSELKKWHDEEYYRQRADSLASNLHKIGKKDKKAVIENVHNPEEILEIDINGEMLPSENLAHLYKLANKAASIKDEVPRIIDTIERQIDRYKLALQDRKVLFELVKKLKRKNPEKTKKQKVEKKHYREFFHKGFKIFIGKNAAGNDYITLRLAKAHDYWLHARGVPGSHVVIKRNKNQQIPREVLIVAAKLAAFYSNNRYEGITDVIYTERRWVQKISGRIGAVRTLQDKTIAIKPASEKDVSEYRIQ
ncbi:MAG: NFACT RNA binding domain-containing protein [Candidatus Zixiibacteriota bacterium]